MDQLKHRFTFELTDQNIDKVFEALTRTYLKMGDDSITKSILALSNCLAGIVVARYSKATDKEEMTKEAMALLAMINATCLAYVDHLQEKE